MRFSPTVAARNLRESPIGAIKPAWKLRENPFEVIKRARKLRENPLFLPSAEGHLPAAGVFLVARGFATGTGEEPFPRRPFERSGLAFGFGHGRFACDIVVPVVHCSDPRLATNQRLLGSLEVSCFQAATIQIP